MAVVTGPLHSQSASGQLGKTLIYQPSRGQNVVRAYGKPNWTANPPTADQLAVQAFTKLLMEHWLWVGTEDKASWQELAESREISPVNAYCIENWRRHRGNEPLLDGWPDILSTIVAGVITAGYPMPDPDCTGDYKRTADYEGQPAYTRISDGLYYVYYDPLWEYWSIDAILGTRGSISSFYRDDSNIEGEYLGNFFNGNAIFALS
jgi:hypothetical protein